MAASMRLARRSMVSMISSAASSSLQDAMYGIEYSKGSRPNPADDAHRDRLDYQLFVGVAEPKLLRFRVVSTRGRPCSSCVVFGQSARRRLPDPRTGRTLVCSKSGGSTFCCRPDAAVRPASARDEHLRCIAHDPGSRGT
jgi:hypothetical protein